MKKGLILSSVTAIILTNNSYANTNLGEVLVTTATKTEKNIEGVSASIIVVTKEEIEKISASTLKDVLEKIPSINAQFARFPHPSSASKASISIRGVGANGTLILLDGKRLSAETENPYEMNRIPASIIERIEIVKGSMSTLYGSDAIGGVINIITKKITKPQTAVDLKYGLNNKGDAKQKNFNFTNIGKNDYFNYKVFGSIVDSTPFTKKKKYTQSAVNPNTGSVIGANPQNGILGSEDITYMDDATVLSFGTRFEKYLTPKLLAGLDFNYFKEEREGVYLGNAKFAGGGLIKNTPILSKDDNRRVDVSTDFEYQVNNDLTTNLRFYRSYYKKRNETTPVNFAGPVNKKFSANVTIDNVESTTTYLLNDSNIFTFGAEYRKETRDSSAINPNANSSDFITKEVTYKSIYLQDEIGITDSLNATIGARYDHISNADSKVTFQAGVVQRFTENTSLRANYSQGFRAPDIAELYVVSPVYKDGKRFGSDVIYGPKTSSYDLKPEESQSFEIALSNKYNNFSSEIVAFHTNIKDKIELVSYGAGASKYYTSENLDKVEINGLELRLDYDFNEYFNTNFHLTYLDTEDKTLNKELTFTPEVSAYLGLDYKISNNLKTNLSFRYIGEQYTNSQNSDKTDDYTLVDLGLNYKINKTASVYGGIDNIFDKKVEEELGVNAGTYMFVGLRFNF
ncbi:TonB-dependent receptor [Malaciobacter mytili LMG 24559]|uniref:TonB-dependent receptor n=1 Tax=Malaciobacter mytili LMG 24559 TaxID=1032238 RepID=A0AAX2ADJ4_9BACT|nr:TonB-dependent receptor [Malaciobacter mytili]AXH15984.1 TonB-dependent receptor [Malaciobacter mytili LMG 24559]RXK13664.1 TonB-dependent receptor [Malaciobacter mytili LMG 24559]